MVLGVFSDPHPRAAGREGIYSFGMKALKTQKGLAITLSNAGIVRRLLNLTTLGNLGDMLL